MYYIHIFFRWIFKKPGYVSRLSENYSLYILKKPQSENIKCMVHLVFFQEAKILLFKSLCSSLNVSIRSCILTKVPLYFQNSGQCRPFSDKFWRYISLWILFILGYVWVSCWILSKPYAVFFSSGIIGSWVPPAGWFNTFTPLWEPFKMQFCPVASWVRDESEI